MTWDSVQDAGRDAVGWSLVADFAKGRYESARTFIANELSAQNSRGLDVEADGEIVGSVSCGQAKDGPDVTDDAAFLAYVVDNHPEALRVDSKWKDMFLRKLAAADGVYVDKATGEIVPGVEKVRSRPYWKVTKTPEAKERMRMLLSGITPSLTGIKAIEGEK